MHKKTLAVLAGSAIALSASPPAMAATWDGNYFDFGLGTEWELSSYFKLSDVDMGTFALGFVQPAVTGIFTDIWDTGLTMSVVSPTDGINDTYDCTTNSSDIDLTTDDDDLVITCLENWAVLPTPDVEVNGEIRIFGPNGDLVRYTLEIQNLSVSDITDFEVATYTNWGSDGDIWAYQNYDSAVLAVPAPDLSTNAAALQTVDSNWVVNYTDDDAPGSLAWGHDDGSVNVD